MPGVGPDRRVTALQGASAVRVQGARLVLHGPDEAAAAAHQEPAVPLVGQQQLEVDLRLDGPGHPAVRRLPRLARHAVRLTDPQIDQRQRGEVGARIGRPGGRGRTRGGERQTRGNGKIHELALSAGHSGRSLCLRDPPQPYQRAAALSRRGRPGPRARI